MRVAIIPARGGSKRIPKKNIKLFHGKAMIGYAIEAAKASGCFDRIIVSTDDQEIADVALSFGAEVPFMRPDEISDDHATTLDVVKHGVEWLITEGHSLSAVCCIYATAPFLRAEDLISGYKKLSKQQCSYVFSATTFAFPIQRAIELTPQGSVKMFYPDTANVRSQDLIEAYHDAGQFYWGTPQAFMDKLPIFSEHAQVVLLARKRVQDIDTPEDWDFAETLFMTLKQQNRQINES